MRLKTDNSYDKRKVRYEHIHSIDPNDFKKFIEIINPRNNQIILDACCGYWSVTKKINEKISENNLNTKIYAVDSSNLQISRAKEEIWQFDNVRIIQSDVINVPFNNNFFDTIVIKMWLHEVTKEMQIDMINELKRVLKPWGKIVIWELALTDKTQPIFSKFIREKDKLWEFTSLVANRYFPKAQDILELLGKSGFINQEKIHDIYPRLSVKNRETELISALRIKMEQNWEVNENLLEEKSKQRVQLLINFAKTLNEEEKKIMKYEEIKNKNNEIEDVIMSAEKWIFIAHKPM